MSSICVRPWGNVETLPSISMNTENCLDFVINTGLKRALSCITYLENRDLLESLITFDELVNVG